MSYINFKGILKKATHKPGGEVEILLIVPTQSLRGQFENLSEMIECDVIGGLDSQVVRFTKLINAKTNKPIIQYKIDDNGLVTELKKPEGEQLTADDQLGLAPEKVTIKEEPVELSLTLINDFILSGMAPNYQDLDHDFMLITRRILDGETYMKLAADEGMAMMLFNMAVDEYRQRIAPLAMKWDEWRNGEIKSSVPKTVQNMSNFVENNTESGEKIPNDPYLGKVVVLIQEDTDNEIKYIFPIVNGQAALPNRFINGEFNETATFGEVIDEIGLLGIETEGVIFYQISDLIGFGAHLRDADTVLIEGNKVAYPDYFGKEIVISKEDAGDLIEYVFPIIGDAAGIPIRFVNGEYDSSLAVNEVKFEIGAAPITDHPSGEVRYFTPELLEMFGGSIRIVEVIDIVDQVDADSDLEADLDDDSDIDQNELDIQADSLNKEISFKDEQPNQEQQPKAEPAASDIEAFILTNKPNFEDIPYDFPAIIAEKKETGKSWMDIASSLKESTTKLQTALTKYKKKVRDMMMGGAA